MNQKGIWLTYKSAEHIASSLDWLKASWPDKSSYQSAVDEIQRNVAKGAREWARLVRLHHKEPELVRAAAVLYPHVVRCGDWPSHSYLELALMYGERIATVFVPDDAFGRRHIDTRDLQINLPDDGDLILDFLRGYAGGLKLHLEHEYLLLTSKQQTTWMPNVVTSSNVHEQLNVAAPFTFPLPETGNSIATGPFIVTFKHHSVATGGKPFPVTVKGNAIAVKGKEFPVKPHLAQFVRLLLEARKEGRIVPGAEFEDIPGCRRKNLPREFKNLYKKVPPLKGRIASEKGKGGGRYFKD